MRLIFLDTETTGLLPEDRLCQVAYTVDGQSAAEFFLPPLPIKIEAMSVHHITNKMLIGKAPFVGSQMHSDLAALLADEQTAVVAHNAAFDIEMLQREGLVIKNSICTLKVARYFDRDGTQPRFNLQYLRYLLDLDVEAVAHDAAGDVAVLERLFANLFARLKAELGTDSDEAVYSEMMMISSRPSLIQRFNFGKHNGKRIDEVLLEDRRYLEWLLDQKRLSNGEEDWIYTLEHFLD
ncbi:MAG: exonuclease domain-containing protein [Patescibacteria group bacterium]